MDKALLIVSDPRFGHLIPEPLQSEIMFTAIFSGKEREIIPLFADCEPENLEENLRDYLESSREYSKDPDETIAILEKVAEGFSQKENRLKLSEELFNLMSSALNSLFNQQLDLCRNQLVIFKI